MTALKRTPQMFRPCLAFLLAGAFCFHARAASFDCAKAQRPIEKTICADPALSDADSRMAQTYHDVLARLTTRNVGVVRVDQLQWLAWMQQVCRADAPQDRSGAIAACLKPLYDDRIRLMRLSVVRHDGVTFFTRTQYLASAETDAHGSPRFAGFGTLQASWPQADSEGAQWTPWNAAVEKRLLVLASANPSNAAGPPRDAADWTDTLAAGTDTTLAARIHTIEHDRVTTEFNVEGMGHGAAHAFGGGETLTWLLTRKRALQAGDVFVDGSPWQKVVATACWQQLQKGEQREYLYPEITGPDAKPLRDVLANPANWTLEHDGLHISYPEYTVAPRMAPPNDAVIPWSDLQPVLQAGFQMP